MRPLVILLCDKTGIMADPWLNDGYDAVLVDPQHPEGMHTNGSITRIGGVILDSTKHLGHLLRTRTIGFVFGFPPCTDVAVSGSRWFTKKGLLDPHYQSKAALVAEQCRMIGMLSGAPWGFENPVSVFSSIFGKPDHIFQPYEFTNIEPNDNYFKKTCLWTGGGLVMPSPQISPQVCKALDIVLAVHGKICHKVKALEVTGNNRIVELYYPDDRIHHAVPGDERANFRSATPTGFAIAMRRANTEL